MSDTWRCLPFPGSSTVLGEGFRSLLAFRSIIYQHSFLRTDLISLLIIFRDVGIFVQSKDLGVWVDW